MRCNNEIIIPAVLWNYFKNPREIIIASKFIMNNQPINIYVISEQLDVNPITVARIYNKFLKYGFKIQLTQGGKYDSI